MVILYAEDQLMRLRMTRRMHTYQRTTDAQIARDIAREHGLDADVDADGATYDVVQQFNQSDLAFLRERARRIQAELWCTGSTLHFRTRDKRQGTSVTAVQGNQLLSARIGADLAHQRSSVTVTGYDASGQRAINEQAERSAPDQVWAVPIRGDPHGGPTFASPVFLRRRRRIPGAPGQRQRPVYRDA